MDPTLDSAVSATHHARLTSTFLRGLAHELANAVQMLSLEPPPASALAATRERLTTAMEVLAALAAPEESQAGPTLLPDALREVALWHRLQSGLPDTRLELEAATSLPAVAAGHAHVRDALLVLLTAAKQGGATTASLKVAQVGERVRCELAHDGTVPLSSDARAYIESRGATLRCLSPTRWEASFDRFEGITGSA